MNYKQLGFKAGLEIHQQIDSSKLFCSCPSELREDKPDFIVKRQLRAVPGEHGEIDVAAFYEQLKGKFFIYEGYDENTCLVELDEEPPHPINEDALQIALTVAKMMHCEIPNEMQVMRKTVVDGSNTSGFQRTVLVGKNGYIKVGKKKVGINFLILEEDAARRTAEDEKSVTYRLDRLGIPMLEIVTAPDMETPEEVQETAKTIGSLLRSTGKMRRGIGTIRQDVNVSIKGHTRVEMKGVQDLRVMHKYIEKEVERQVKTKGKEEAHVRNVKPDFTSKYLRPLPGAARMYPETDIPMVKPNLKGIELPELIEEKTKRFEKLGLGRDLAPLMAQSEKSNLFEELVKKYKKVKPAFIAETLTGTLLELKRDYQIEGIKDDDLREIFGYLNEGKIHKDIILSVLVDTAKGEFDIKKYESLGTEDLHQELISVIKENKGAPFGALMGKAMAKLKGKASGEKISKMLKELLEKGH
ncbi:Glu-tRNA(Gln) amidotransferase subunit GatE [Candidatus Woesearchaeota archaeon]|nr:Glu-tRNA(Gln) amidotransferase subunit GatE [Candidatus Woesearchaeota archaeon]